MFMLLVKVKVKVKVKLVPAIIVYSFMIHEW